MTISLFLYSKACINNSVQYLTYTLYAFRHSEKHLEQPTTSAALVLDRGAQIR